LQHQGRRHLEEYEFDAFMSVFCVLTMEIFYGVIPCVTVGGGGGFGFKGQLMKYLSVGGEMNWRIGIL
jgi:hypothetical protein